ncbi:hypothetical protein CLLI_25060 [Clostridium liquoris]|jgi:hypothetical protein|uniref:DUF2871 domain-containing protein n=1 Tax=Clostridium liquoris TaxID=1289519 RepID=A0A2T0B1D3_9CLOT|nr:DUF2871 domain-containing protein [Clostridium liquoris]PRR77333.1 hypothetical protein CLLI_25060 [Clostridium liquoris]
MKKLYQTSFFYLILGLIGGVFYREFTKLNNFNGITALKALHPHFLVLGFLFFLILTLASFKLNLSQIKGFNKWYVTYNIGLLFTGITFLWRGILQVQSLDFKGLNHIAGLGHTILGVSLIWFMIILKKALEQKNM